MTRKVKQHILSPASWKKLVSLGIILALAATLAVSLPRAALAQSTEQALTDARVRQEALEEQRKALQREKRQLSESLDELSGQLAWLNERSEEQRQIYLQKTIQLEAAISEMEQAYREYAEAQEHLIAKQEQYVERMKVMFDHRNQSLFKVFLEADSIQGFFTTLQFMTIVADADQQMLEDLEIAQDQAQLKRQVAIAVSEEMDGVVKQLEIDLARLQADAEATALDMNQLSRQISEREQADAELAAESERVGNRVAELQKQLEAERAAQATAAAQATRAAQASIAAEATRAAERAAAEEAARRAAEEESRRAAEEAARRAAEEEARRSREEESQSSPDRWVWPVPGRTHISSYYGTRVHPVWGDSRFHSGIDIPAPFGHPIVSVADGTVIIVENRYEGLNWGGYGYGNYIVVDHGGGIATLYAHLKNTHVRPFDQVKAGDRIGTCGSTGTSTGSHLHFEVSVNGRHTNPLPYLR